MDFNDGQDSYDPPMTISERLLNFALLPSSPEYWKKYIRKGKNILDIPKKDEDFRYTRGFRFPMVYEKRKLDSLSR